MLLSICPFFKIFNKSIKNYLIFLNLEKKPYFRKCKLNIYESYKQKLVKSDTVYSNKINIISLNDLHFDYEKLIFDS